MADPGPTPRLGFGSFRSSMAMPEDNRMLVGTFMAFDKYMNVVLADCEDSM